MTPRLSVKALATLRDAAENDVVLYRKDLIVALVDELIWWRGTRRRRRHAADRKDDMTQDTALIERIALAMFARDLQLCRKNGHVEKLLNVIWLAWFKELARAAIRVVARARRRTR